MFKHNIFFIILIVTGILSAQDRLLVTTGPSDNPAVMIITPIITKTYDSLNIEIEVLNISWARSILVADKGESDAELFRTAMITEKYKNLVRVNEPVISLDMVVFVRDKSINVKTWKDLAPYRIAFMRGVKSVEKNTMNYKVFQVNTLEKAFDMLDKGRVDIVIEEFFNGSRTVRKMGLKDVHVLENTLESFPVYHFLHYKNRELVPLLEKKLREFKADGTISKIRKEVSERVLGN